ncbi:MAG: hypothetical protein ACJ0N6_04190 [Thermodesulfobacteriota bacterium]
MGWNLIVPGVLIKESLLLSFNIISADMTSVNGIKKNINTYKKERGYLVTI